MRKITILLSAAVLVTTLAGCKPATTPVAANETETMTNQMDATSNGADAMAPDNAMGGADTAAMGNTTGEANVIMPQAQGVTDH